MGLESTIPNFHITESFKKIKKSISGDEHEPGS
jgi:hypothetical protein